MPPEVCWGSPRREEAQGENKDGEELRKVAMRLTEERVGSSREVMEPRTLSEECPESFPIWQTKEWARHREDRVMEDLRGVRSLKYVSKGNASGGGREQASTSDSINCALAIGVIIKIDVRLSGGGQGLRAREIPKFKRASLERTAKEWQWITCGSAPSRAGGMG